MRVGYALSSITYTATLTALLRTATSTMDIASSEELLALPPHGAGNRRQFEYYRSLSIAAVLVNCYLSEQDTSMTLVKRGGSANSETSYHQRKPERLSRE
jgi:hypothetical protein